MTTLHFHGNDCVRDEARFMDREEFDSDGNTIEENHFMMQLARLPQNGQGTIRKLLQLALNLGQYRHATKDFIALKHIMVATYINDAEHERINLMIGPTMIADLRSLLSAKHAELDIPFYDLP